MNNGGAAGIGHCCVVNTFWDVVQADFRRTSAPQKGEGRYATGGYDRDNAVRHPATSSFLSGIEKLLCVS